MVIEAARSRPDTCLLGYGYVLVRAGAAGHSFGARVGEVGANPAAKHRRRPRDPSARIAAGFVGGGRHPETTCRAIDTPRPGLAAGHSRKNGFWNFSGAEWPGMVVEGNPFIPDAPGNAPLFTRDHGSGAIRRRACPPRHQPGHRASARIRRAGPCAPRFAPCPRRTPPRARLSPRALLALGMRAAWRGASGCDGKRPGARYQK